MSDEIVPTPPWTNQSWREPMREKLLATGLFEGPTSYKTSRFYLTFKDNKDLCIWLGRRYNGIRWVMLGHDNYLTTEEVLDLLPEASAEKLLFHIDLFV
jgi:hypothetical protein